jgi:cytochrome c biogenesis protein CcmG/thiol:disulfide interchange protein DsbE
MENNSQMHVGHWVDQRLAALTPDKEWTPDTSRALACLRDGRYVRRGRGPIWTWSAAAATALLCLIALPAPRAFAHYCLNCSVALWQNLSTSTVARAGLKPESARKPAPDFTLSDASGRPVQLSSLKGKVVLLNFWATWCGGCKVEIPWLIDFQQAYSRRGLEVLGVSFDDDGWKLVKPYIAAKHVDYPVMIGKSHIAALYGGVEALPVTFVVDKSGRIASTHLGLVFKIDYQTEIEKLLSE